MAEQALKMCTFIIRYPSRQKYETCIICNAEIHAYAIVRRIASDDRVRVKLRVTDNKYLIFVSSQVSVEYALLRGEDYNIDAIFITKYIT